MLWMKWGASRAWGSRRGPVRLLRRTGAEARPERSLEMKGLFMLAWLLACSVPAVPGSLLDLKSMIEKVTGKPALKSYGFYGCHCGWGGRGTPKDGTDWCCWKHDRCYAQLETQDCDVLTQAYRYRVAWGFVICEHGSRCQRQLCACDQKFVYCLKRNMRSYNPLYQYFPNFLCT